MPVPNHSPRTIAPRVVRWLGGVAIVLAAACGESPASPAAGDMAAPRRGLTTTTDTIMVTGTLNSEALASTSAHVTFSTQATSGWDDIRITHGSTVIVERFDNGAWNAENFELADATRPGAVIDGEYRSTGTVLDEKLIGGTVGGALRTKAQFVPTATTPLVIEVTYRSGAVTSYPYYVIVWRSPGGLLPYSQFLGTAFLVVPPANIMGLVRVVDEEPFRTIPGDFLSTPAYVRIVDNGTTVTVTLTRNSTTPNIQPRVTSTGFRAPVSGSSINVVKAGSSVPLKFQLKRGDEIVSSLSEVTGVAISPVACDVLGGDTQTVTASTSLPSGLRYDSVDQQFVYVWQTPRDAGCHVAKVTLTNGDAFTAKFNARR